MPSLPSLRRRGFGLHDASCIACTGLAPGVRTFVPPMTTLALAPTMPTVRAALPPRHDCIAFDPCGQAVDGHDAITKASIAAALARQLGLPFAGTYSTREHGPRRAYVVPCETLSQREAAAWGVFDASDLFGGVAPLPFVATKIISHSLVGAGAMAPAGWNAVFGEWVKCVVLEGWSAFSLDDAHVAGARLLRDGAVRVKDAAGVGGGGQTVVHDPAALERALAARSPDSLRTHGVVLERNLNRVHTHSVGQVQIGALMVSYAGHQRLARNLHGHEVYAGSTLRVVRGGFDALLRQDLPDAVHLAVGQALDYHRAAMASFHGLFASRSNYDVAQGFDDAGVWRSGVLEQSWRVGGASGAELAAVQALRERPDAAWVDASTHEVYGDDAVAPADAQVHFDAVDPRVGGRLLKYARVDAHGSA